MKRTRKPATKSPRSDRAHAIAALVLVLPALVACGGSDPQFEGTSDAGTLIGDASPASNQADANGGDPPAAPDAGDARNMHDASIAVDGGESDSSAPIAVTAASLLALTETCKTKLSTSPFAKDEGGAATVDVCGLTGAVFFDADMDVDCDGKSSAICSSATDPDFENDTAAQASTGGPLDAATLPFIVVPGVSTKWSYSASGLSLGSVVAVVYNGKLAFGIIGDIGPKTIIGEGSYAMASALGIPGSPTTGGVSSGVTYIAFTGKNSVVAKNEDHAAAVTLGTARAQAVLAAN